MSTLLEIKRVGGDVEDISSVSTVFEGTVSGEHSPKDYDKLFDSIEKNGFALLKGVKIQIEPDTVLVAGDISDLGIEDAANISTYAFSPLKTSDRYVSASFLKVCEDGALLVGGIIK